MKAIGFDLGRTLVSYEGIPMNWASFYKEVLSSTLLKCHCDISEERIIIGEKVLAKYNTRINQREIEVSSEIILNEILDGWKLSEKIPMSFFKDSFFKFFQRKVLPFEDTISTITTLKNMGIKIGVLTDVPYGMDREYVLSDVEPFSELIDVLLTSVDVGYRKPNLNGYHRLAKELSAIPEEMIFVGDEPKDVIGANNAGMFSVLIEKEDIGKDYGQNRTIKELKEIIDIVKLKKC